MLIVLEVKKSNFAKETFKKHWIRKSFNCQEILSAGFIPVSLF